MSNVIIKTDKLCKSFSSGGMQQHILKNLDIEIYKGDYTVIMGSSGSGKSTLLYAISGMDKASLGEINFNGHSLSKLNHDQLALFRRQHCGFVFQQVHLLDNMSILDNILSSGLLTGKRKSDVILNAKTLLKDVGLSEVTWHKFPSQLSGGEAQRAGIVRALINEPSIIFADEPTGALNSASSGAVLDVLTKINQNGQSIVMVTHDLKSALRGNRILYLRDGLIFGDLRLGDFNATDYAIRQEKLTSFLNEMGW